MAWSIYSPSQWQAMAAQNQADAMSGENMSGNIMPWFSGFAPETLQRLGYTGSMYVADPRFSDPNRDDFGTQMVNPEALQFLEGRGYQIGIQGGQGQLFDQSGNPVGEAWQAGNGDDRAFWTAALLAGGLVGSQFANFNPGAGSTSPIVSSVPQAVAPDLAALGTAGTGSGVAIGGGGAAGGIAGSAMAPGAITSTVPAATVPSLGAAGGTIPTAAGTTIAGSGGTSALARVGTGLAGQLISGAMQANAAQNASAAQQAAAAQGQASLQGVYDRIAQLMQPFVGAGVTAIDAQQALIGTKGPEAQRAAIAALESSPEFSSLVKQGEEAILANASATGGLRGGNVQAALGQFRPAVLSRLINQQIERLAGLSQQGQNAAAGVGSAGVNIGGGIANLMQQQGAAQAGGELARGQTNAGYVNAITNAIGMYFGLKGG